MAASDEHNQSEHIEHMKLYAGLSERIGVLSERLSGEHGQNIERLDGHFRLIMEKLKPLDEIKLLRKDVDEHKSKISFVRGSIAVMGFVYTSALAFLGIHRHQ